MENFGVRWICREGHPNEVGPYRYLDKFPTAVAVTAGQLLERTNDTNTRWIPIDSDHDASAGAGLAIAGRDRATGDAAGLDEIIVPRPGDVFEFDLAAAAATEPETAMYYSSPTALAASGSNILAYSVLGTNAPSQQKLASKGELGDSGETYRSTNRVRVVFRAACSFWKTIQKA